MRYTQKYLEENNIKQNHSQEELNEILGVVKKISDATGLSGFVKKSAGEFVSQLFNGLFTLGAAGTVDTYGGVAWWAHVGGFIIGLLLVKFFERRRYRPFPTDAF